MYAVLHRIFQGLLDKAAYELLAKFCVLSPIHSVQLLYVPYGASVIFYSKKGLHGLKKKKELKIINLEDKLDTQNIIGSINVE